MEKFIEKIAEAIEREDEIKMEDEFRTYDEWSSIAYLSVIAFMDDEYDTQIEGIFTTLAQRNKAWHTYSTMA